MFSKLKGLCLEGHITKDQLLCLLREYAREFNYRDIMHCSLQIQQEAECIHTSYKEEYIKAEIGFLIRIIEVKKDKLCYDGPVDVKELNNAIGILAEQEKMATETNEMNPTILRYIQSYHYTPLSSRMNPSIRWEPYFQVVSQLKKRGISTLARLKITIMTIHWHCAPFVLQNRMKKFDKHLFPFNCYSIKIIQNITNII